MLNGKKLPINLLAIKMQIEIRSLSLDALKKKKEFTTLEK